MILPILILAQVMSGGPMVNPVIDYGPVQAATPQANPLKCEKYQHVYHWPSACGPSSCSDVGGMSSCDAVCYPPPPDRCVDDMHSITERDWQALMERLNRLETKQAANEIHIPATGGIIQSH